MFDFYFPREVVDKHYTKCLVVEHEGERFRALNLKSQQKRLDPKFRIQRLETLRTRADRETKKEFDVMLKRLREIQGSSLG